MRKIFLAIVIGILAMAMQLHAQTINFTARILDAQGKPVPGASARIKGSASGTIADDQGNISLTVSRNDIIEISSSGFSMQEVTVDGKSNMIITLVTAATELQQVVFVGTRRPGRVKTETPVPVDVISFSSPQPTGRMDLTSMMNYAAPSLNYNKQSGSDGADHVELATLRGLGPDQTLVLVNGKRRHQTSFVSVFGTRGRGNSGTDLNAIPLSSIDRVEILRDGASAQYGSDAIAGVINIVLKNSVNRLTGNVGLSAYYDPKFNTAFKKGLGHYLHNHKLDGQTLTAGLNYGMPIGKQDGFINLSADFLTNGKTFRQALDTSDPVNNKNGMYTNVYRRANGDASLDYLGLMFNMELPAAGNSRFYSFGGHTYKYSDAYAFTRNFSLRPERFPTDVNGNVIEYPGIIRTAADGEKYFNPHIQTSIRDVSWAAGFRGSNKSGWSWDLSNAVGFNRFEFFGYKTFNASYGSSKTSFKDGGFSFLQNTTNVNVSREWAAVAEGLNLAFGAENRFERYVIFAGEPASYTNYSTGDKATGAQGFPGYQPADEVKANRNNVAAYADLEIDISEKWLLNTAVRFENYNDFGSTLNYKIASRFKIGNHFNLRGSYSTGFRAPSLQQINFSSTFTTVQGGNIAEVKIAPNYSSITRAAGIPELKQERSQNVSVGFTWSPIPALSITVDGYQVQIRDRVVLSGQFDASAPGIDPALAAEMNSLNVGLAQFFANAVNTTNKGVDMIVDYNYRWSQSRLKFLFAGNIQEMKLDQINVPTKLSGSDALKQNFLSDREQAFILASAPPQKFALNVEYGYKKWTIGTRLNYFGTVKILGYGEDGLGINPTVPADADPNIYVKDEYTYNGKFVTDLYGGFAFNQHLSVQFGADNLLNVHPDLGIAPGAKGWAYNNEPAGPFDAVQMGSNGRRLFFRMILGFGN